MARNKGIFDFSNNFEVRVEGPLDAKQLVGTKADLALLSTWESNIGAGDEWTYVGMIVSVWNDGANNGIYRLTAVDYTDINNWEKLGSKADIESLSTAISQTITGMTSLSTTISSSLSTEISARISGDTYIISLSGETVIGLPMDNNGSYGDGIFTWFVPTTRVGVVVDKFNEMFKLLAPSPPLEGWDNVFSNLTIPSLFTARALTTGSVITSITTDTTPSYSLSNTVGNGALARSRSTAIFTMKDNGGTLETHTVTPSSVTRSGNIINYTVADPYYGISGEAGFWTGLTAFSVGGTLSTITPSSSSRVLTFEHPGSDSPESLTYYVDTPLTVIIGAISATVPAMNGFISGVPTLTTGQVITAIGFSIVHVSSYFYAATSVWQLNAGLVGGSTGDPDAIPTSYDDTKSVTNKTATVLTGQYNDTALTFSVRGRNSFGTYGSNTTYNNPAFRVDTVSVETSRKTSGTGSYPSTGWGGTYDSTQPLNSTYTNEMQLKNGIYQYPASVNYSGMVGGPNYTTGISGTRWVTFTTLATFASNSKFTLNFIGLVGTLPIVGNTNLLVEVKISGATYWVNGNAAWDNVHNPGSTGDNDYAACSSSTTSSRTITFGSLTYSGAVVIRVGQTSNIFTFTSLTAVIVV